MATTTITYEISPKAEKWIRISAVLVMLLVATASLILSFDGLRKLAIAAHVPEELAFLFPLAVDSTILMGSLAVLRMHLGGQKAALGWGTVFFGTALSIAGNVISVKDAGMIAMALHSVPPVLIAVSLELLMSLLRVNIKKTHIVSESDTPEPQTTLPVPATPTVAVVESVQQSAPILAAPVIQEAVVVAPINVPSVITEPVITPPVVLVPDEPVIAEEPVNLLLPVAPLDIASIPVEDEPDEFVSPIFNSLAEETDIEKKQPVNQVEANIPTVSPDKATAKTASDANIEAYKKIISKLSENSSRAKKMAAVLHQHPDAKINELKKAIGDPANTSYTADMKRVKEFLAKKA